MTEKYPRVLAIYDFPYVSIHRNPEKVGKASWIYNKAIWIIFVSFKERLGESVKFNKSLLRLTYV